MSYDLLVYGTDPPSVPDETGPWTMDGPLHAEDEDAPEVVAAALLEVRWLVEITVPDSMSGRDLKRALRFARTVAESGRGVVYDPQEDRIIWPRSVKRLRSLPRRDDDVGRVELEWLVARRLTSDDARALLAALRVTVPEALPRRFGYDEPLEFRFDRDGEDAFAQLWDGSPSPWWKGSFPVAECFVTLRRAPSPVQQQQWQERAPVLGGRRAPEVDELTITFHTDVVDDERWLVALERLFARVCDLLDPFFAAAFASPQPDAHGMALQGRHWLGIPDADFWLVRLGEPYLALVPGEPLRKLGPSPVAWDQLERMPWPAELVRRGGYADEHLAAAVIPPLGTG